jgi:hypothetical protein
LVTGVVALTLWSVRAAAADPPRDPAAAESLFEEGRKLLDAGKVPEACAKLEASNRMDPAVGTLLNLGDCNERRGRIASAWGNYRAAQSLALTRNDANRADFAKKKADAIQPKLSTLTVAVPQPEPGLKVSRDGTLIDDGAWGTPIPVDPGPHTIEANAPGKKSVTLKITVPEGSPSANTVKLDPLVADPGAAASGPSSGGAAPPPKEDIVKREPFFTTGRVVGFTGIGLGAAAIGVGSVFAIQAKSSWDDVGSHCDSAAACDPEGLKINSDARDKGNVATVLIVAGLVVAAAGAACLLFWPKPAPPKSALHWTAAGLAF